MDFLTSLSLLFVIYLILFFIAMNIKRGRGFPEIGKYSYGLYEPYVAGISSAYLFCICYHIFIATVTAGTASFNTYFIPCLIIAVLYIIGIIYDIIKEI